jgi:hypothetical protein
MDWQPLAHDRSVLAAEDYRIVPVSVAEAVWYELWAPALDPKRFDSLLKIQYAMGEHVPQRRALLGHFADPTQAREAAESHKAGTITGKVRHPFP